MVGSYIFWGFGGQGCIPKGGGGVGGRLEGVGYLFGKQGFSRKKLNF